MENVTDGEYDEDYHSMLIEETVHLTDIRNTQFVEMQKCGSLRYFSHYIVIKNEEAGLSGQGHVMLSVQSSLRHPKSKTHLVPLVLKHKRATQMRSGV